MIEPLFHPRIEDLQMSAVLAALSDPFRLAIVRRLIGLPAGIPCNGLGDSSYKTRLSYHLKILREAGVTQTRVEGTSRIVSLRTTDLARRFPGLLDAILAAEPEPSELLEDPIRSAASA